MLFGSSRSFRLFRTIILHAGPQAKVGIVEILLCKKVFQSLLEQEYTHRK